jgi:hypothetical protein
VGQSVGDILWRRKVDYEVLLMENTSSEIRSGDGLIRVEITLKAEINRKVLLQLWV